MAENTKREVDDANRKLGEKFKDNLREISASINGIDKEPKFIKAYSVLDNYGVFIDVTMKLPPGSEKYFGYTTDKEVEIKLFQDPNVNVKSFSVQYKARTADLVVVDPNESLGEILMSYLFYMQQHYFGGNLVLDVKYGYYPPANPLQRKIQRSVRLSKVESYIVSNIKTNRADFNEYTFELQLLDVSNIVPTAYSRPYKFISSYPAMGIALVNFLSREIYGKALDGNINDPNWQSKINKHLRVHHGIGRDVPDDIMRSFYAEFKKTDIKILKESAIKDSEEIRKFYTGFIQNEKAAQFISYLSPIISLEKIDPVDLFGYAYSALKNNTVNSKVLPVCVYFGKNKMIIDTNESGNINDIIAQLKKRRATFDGSGKTGLSNLIGTENTAKINKSIASKNEDINNILNGIRVSDMHLKQSDSWEWLFKQICEEIKIDIEGADSNTKEEIKNNATEITGQFNGYKEDTTLNEETGARFRNYYDVKASRLEQIRKIRSLYPKIGVTIRVTNPGKTNNKDIIYETFVQLKNAGVYGNETLFGKKGGSEIDKAISNILSTIESIHEYASGKYEYIMYIVLHDTEGGPVFDQNFLDKTLVQAYTHSPVYMNDEKYFNSGISKLQNNEMPDVISFEPEFELWQGIMTSIKNEEMQNSFGLNSLLNSTDTQKLENQNTEENDQEQKKEEAATLKQAQKDYQYVKNVKSTFPLPNRLNVSRPNIYTAANDGLEDYAQAKKTYQRIRARLALGSANTKGKLTIFGEPNFGFEHIRGDIKLFIKDYDINGDLTMFTGIYQIMDCGHQISDGRFTTSFDIQRAYIPGEPSTAQMIQYFADKDSFTVTTSKKKYNTENKS